MCIHVICGIRVLIPIIFITEYGIFLGAVGCAGAAAPVNTDIGFFTEIRRLDISKTVHGKRLLTTENTEVTEDCCFVSVFSVPSVVF